MNTELEATILEMVGRDPNGVTTERICTFTKKKPQELGDLFERLLNDRKLLGFAGLWMSVDGYIIGGKRLVQAMRELHDVTPTETDISPARAVKAAELSWTGKPLDRILSRLANEGKIEINPKGISLRDFVLVLTPRQVSLLDRVIEAIESDPISTPTPQDIAQSLGIPRQAIEEILRLGLRSGVVLQLDEVVFYTPKQLTNLREAVRNHAQGKAFTSTELRDALKTTRKYILPLLDHFDEIGFTVKRGTHRVILENQN